MRQGEGFKRWEPVWGGPRGKALLFPGPEDKRRPQSGNEIAPHTLGCHCPQDSVRL